MKPELKIFDTIQKVSLILITLVQMTITTIGCITLDETFVKVGLISVLLSYGVFLIILEVFERHIQKMSAS